MYKFGDVLLSLVLSYVVSCPKRGQLIITSSTRQQTTKCSPPQPSFTCFRTRDNVPISLVWHPRDQMPKYCFASYAWWWPLFEEGMCFEVLFCHPSLTLFPSRETNDFWEPRLAQIVSLLVWCTMLLWIQVRVWEVKGPLFLPPLERVPNNNISSTTKT